MEEIEELDLRGDKEITDEVIKEYVNLKRLILDKDSRITEEGIRNLLELEEIIIVPDGGNSLWIEGKQCYNNFVRIYQVVIRSYEEVKKI